MEQRYGTRDVIAATVAYLVGVAVLFGLALSLYTEGKPSEGIIEVVLLIFSFLFGLAVNRLWALWFPALHWIGYDWLWREARTDLTVHYDAHPLERFSLVAIVMVAGILTRRWVEARRPAAR